MRYALNVYAEDKEGVAIFSYSGGDRVSHITESEARQLTLRHVEASIGEEDFATAFTAWLEFNLSDEVDDKAAIYIRLNL